MDKYVLLARKTIETYLRTGRILSPEGADIPEGADTVRAGAFVSLHRHGALRGCIGTIAPVRASLAEEIVRNAVAAATEDPRFRPLTERELEDLEIGVDVLGEAEDISSPAELDVKRYGVIVTKGWRRGLLLPDLDGVDTVEDQVSIACRKAGLSPDEPGIRLQRFEVVRHE